MYRHVVRDESEQRGVGVTRNAGPLGLAVVLCAVLAACGDDSPPTDGGTDAGPDTSDADVSADVSTDTVTDTALPDTGDTGVPTDVETPDAEPDTISTGSISCEGAISADLTPASGGVLELTTEGGAVPLRLDFLGRELPDGGVTASLTCSDESIVPDGYTSLSPSFVLSAPVGRFARRYFVTVPFELDSFPEGARPSALRVFYRAPGATTTVQPVVVNMQENMRRGTVRFETDALGTFEIGVADDAGTTYDRRWKFRAVTGISMGASGSSMMGMRHPELFDMIGPLGGPTDWGYMAHYIRDGGMGGVGSDEPMIPTEEFEHAQTYDEWYFPTGEGTGGSFNRGDYAQIFLDLMLTFGNIVTYNDESPFAAPGLPLSELQRTVAERCNFTAECGTNEGVYTIDNGYFDDEFNPDGSIPVITFCDGVGSNDESIPFDRACDLDFNGEPDETNEGLYDDPCRQNQPMDITFAVDLNRNGLRDPGEPIVRNFYEPFEDTGVDGLADADEPGYDAATNPDPNFDNYDYALNPTGTEGNWFYNEGEPWQDFGLDGVDGTPQLSDGGFDFGEGNDTYDFNPNLARLLFERNPSHRIREADQVVLDEVTWFIDAGVRDLFNFAVAGNHLVGALQGRGENVRVYDEFYTLQDLTPDAAADYSFAEVDYPNLGENVYLRYGSLDASEEDICFGDGKHVGSAQQVANRLLTMLGYMTNRFPDGETSIIQAPYPQASGTYFMPSDISGGLVRYSIAFPPGYETTQCSDSVDNDRDGLSDGNDPDCLHAGITSETAGEELTACTDGVDNDADGRRDEDDADCTAGDGLSEWPTGHPMRAATFPVIYLMHGYGQSPDDLQVSAIPFSGFMAQGVWPKAILVFPDGYCGDIDQTQCNDGIDNDDDGQVDRADSGCGASGNRSESGEAVAYCADGVDNDLDGQTDSDDEACGNPEWDNEGNCLRGNFYSDHVAWPDGRGDGPAYEQLFLELVDHMDDVYRTREPETFPEIR